MGIEYVYIFFYLIPCLFVYKGVSVKSSINIIFWNFYLLILILYIGARFQIGGDWIQYLYTLEVKDYSKFSISSLHQDPLYEILVYVLYNLNLSVLSLNLICASVFAYGLSKFALRQPSPWLVMTIASSYFIVAVGMGYTRQSFAIGISMLIINALIDRKLIIAIILYIIGSFFHISIILFGIVFLAYLSKINSLLKFTFFCVTFILIFFIFSIVSYERILNLVDFFIIEANEMYYSGGALIRLTINFICAILFLVFANYFTTDLIEKRIYFFISVSVIILFFLSFNLSVFADRLNLYFNILQFFVLSRLPYIFKKFINIYLIKIPVTVFYLLLLIFWLHLSPYQSSWKPYQSYLFPHEDRFDCNKAFMKGTIVSDIVCE